MTLDDVIANLVKVRNGNATVPPDVMGKSTVLLTCPVANVHCWLQDEGFTLEADYAGSPADKLVVITGGFGA